MKLGTWEEALKNIDPDAKPPGWHGSPYVKYVESSQPAKEFGIDHGSDGEATYVITNDLMTNK